MLVETGQAGDRLAGELGVASQLQGVRAVEAVAKANLALLLAVSLFQKDTMVRFDYSHNRAKTRTKKKKLTPFRTVLAAWLA